MTAQANRFPITDSESEQGTSRPVRPGTALGTAASFPASLVVLCFADGADQQKVNTVIHFLCGTFSGDPSHPIKMSTKDKKAMRKKLRDELKRQCPELRLLKTKSLWKIFKANPVGAARAALETWAVRQVKALGLPAMIRLKSCASMFDRPFCL